MKTISFRHGMYKALGIALAGALANETQKRILYSGEECAAWVEAWRKKVAKGDVIVVRYADDRVPRAPRAEKGPQCVTALPMRGGPSGPACRSRFQTTSGGCGQRPWS